MAGIATRRQWWWSSYLPLAVVILLLPPLSMAKYERSVVSDKDLNRRKEACYSDIDNGLWGRGCRFPLISKENCALRCVSAVCYNTIYGQDPLEEGELDFKRAREYRSCLRREVQGERRAKTQ